MATEMPVLYEDSLSLDMTEGEMESIDSSYKGYAADDSDELDDIEMMVKNCQQRLDEDLDKSQTSVENSGQAEKEEKQSYFEKFEVHKEEADLPFSSENQEKGDDFYGIVIKGVKSIAEEEEYHLDESSKQSGTISETGTVQESLDGDVASNILYTNTNESNVTDTDNSNRQEETHFQYQANDMSSVEKQDLNEKNTEINRDENNGLLFLETSIKQEPMDDDDFIQEHDYFGNTDFKVYLNEGMDESNAASEINKNMDEQTEDLDPSQLVQYQDQFSITETGKYKCKFCCCSVSQFMTLKIHIDRLHQTSYSCKYCGKTLPRSQDLASHIKTVHKKELMEKKQQTMSSMGKYLTNKREKEKKVLAHDHGDLHESGRTSLTNGRIYKCKHCPRQFAKSQSLAAHVQWRHKKEIWRHKFDVESTKESKRNKETKSKSFFNRTYWCRYCHKVFYKQQVMASHMKNCYKNTNKKMKISEREKHNIKRSNLFSSEENNFMNVSQIPSADGSSAIKNLKVTDSKSIIHPQKKMIKCVSNRKKTSGIRIEQVLFRCPECSETFATKMLVKVHLNRVHATVWCRYCPKAFYKSSKFLLHIFRHIGDIDWLGERKFFCKLCKIDLPYNKASVVHMKHHLTGKNPQGITLNLEKQILLECEHCGRPFCSRTSLVFHELDHRMARNKRLEKKEEKSALIKKRLQEKCLRDGSDTVKKQKPSVGDLKLSEDLRALGIDIYEENSSLPNKTQQCVNDSDFVPAALIPFKCGMCEARFPNSQFLLHHMTLHMKGQYVFKIEVDKNAEETSKSSTETSSTIPPDNCNTSVASDSLKGTRKGDIEEETSAVSNHKKNSISDTPSEKDEGSVISDSKCQALIDREIARLTSSDKDQASATSKQDHSYAFLSQKAGTSNAVTQTHVEIPNKKVTTTTTLTNNQNNVMTSISKGDKLLILPPKKKSSDFQVSLLKSKEPSSKPATGMPVIIMPSSSSSVPFIQKVSLPNEPFCNKEVSEVRKEPTTAPPPGSTAPVSMAVTLPTIVKDSVTSAAPQPESVEVNFEKAGKEMADPVDLNVALVESNIKSGESTETCESDIDNILDSSSDSECFSDDSDCGISKTVIRGRTQIKSETETENDNDDSVLFSGFKCHSVEKEPGRSKVSLPIKQESKMPQENVPTFQFHGNFKKQLNFKDGQWFECEHCMYLCHTKQMFVNHMQNHKANGVKKMIKCSVCGRKVISKWHLTHHMRMHRRNEYVCSKCGACFETSSLVLKHMVNFHS